MLDEHGGVVAERHHPAARQALSHHLYWGNVALSAGTADTRPRRVLRSAQGPAHWGEP